MVHNIPLELAGQIFPTNLIILEGQGIDIILGMRWMKLHKALLDISTHLVHLDSPVNGKVTLELHAMAHLQTSIHTTIVKRLGEIPIVWEYPDVFSNEPSEMPPDRAVELKIELQPGTTPISKWSY
jgi:hypothetical protein